MWVCLLSSAPNFDCRRGIKSIIKFSGISAGIGHGAERASGGSRASRVDNILLP